MSARHGVDHVERFCPSDFSDDDPLGPLAQRGALKQILHGDAPSTLDVGVSLFEAKELWAQIVQPKLSLSLENASALAFGDHQGKHASQGRLASPSWPAEDDVEPCPHRRFQKRHGASGDGS